MDIKIQYEKELALLFPNVEIKTLTEGGMSYAYEVGNYIVRIPKNKYAADGYKIEEQILYYLKDTIKSVKIPQIKIFESPFFYTIHRKLYGNYWNGHEYLKKTEKEKDLLANDCAIFFAELHSANVKEINTTIRQLHPIEENMRYYLFNDFSDSEIKKAVSYTNTLFSLEDKVLIHNDFYSDNFFLDSNYRLSSVIDFGNSGFFNYNFDFRKILSYEEGDGDFWRRIVHFYEGLTYRKIDLEVIKIINIHNYISFLVYFAKNPTIKDEKINVRESWNFHINHVKNMINEL